MAAKQFGGDVPVDFTSVLKTIEQKLKGELAELQSSLTDNEALHDFEGFNALVVQMQASVRTLDVLTGRAANIYGETWPDPLTAKAEPNLKSLESELLGKVSHNGKQQEPDSGKDPASDSQEAA